MSRAGDAWLQVEIIGWEKYNPRSDRGGFSWFRMDNSFFLHMRQRKGVSGSATVLMCFLLAECSIADGKIFKLRPAFAAEMIGLTVPEVLSGLSELAKTGEIFFKPLEAASSQTDGRTDETDETRRTDEIVNSAEAEPTPAASETSHLANLWNQFCGDLPKVRGLSKERRRKSEIRWRENPSTEYWGEIVVRMSKSRFCRGENKTGWKATFDFLLQPDTHLKVLEGKYDDRKGSPPGSGSPPAGVHQRADDLDSTIADLLGGA